MNAFWEIVNTAAMGLCIVAGLGLTLGIGVCFAFMLGMEPPGPSDGERR